MSTSGIIEDNGACPTDGRNTKKVQFKDNEVDTVEMPVDVMSASTVSWKELLLRNTVESSSSINGILVIAFSDRVQNYLLKDMKTTVVFLGTLDCFRPISYGPAMGTGFQPTPAFPDDFYGMDLTLRTSLLSVPEVGEGLKEANSTVGVSAEDTIEFVPWIVVERRPHQNPKESRKSTVKILVSVEEESKFNAFKKGDFLKLIENEAIKRKGAEGVRTKKVWVANLVANSKGAEMGKAPRLNLDLAGSIGVATRNFFTSNRALEPGKMDFPHVGPPITSNLRANDASSPKGRS
ncbi:hypothetical protein Goklo_028607 [Gossypium klotzschianum]|uniref:Uncharacterized protein n=1 Tax=Gossypium klotzschianum TaxID=34286 RepID=A0A7J8U257_9ROSI|nr:hypothetical protein [Gossypium klotzschianum]